jgi:EAL domain-containing protein (putative c-di-GMP-specific phosphodiesterase class I)
VNIVLDDFGTGYSSLGYLWKFPFSKIKIDRSFVSALDTSASARGILHSIIGLGHGLGMSVTAEGIETEEHAQTLRDLECDYAQGYLLSRPVRVADIAPLILKNFADGLKPDDAVIPAPVAPKALESIR